MVSFGGCWLCLVGLDITPSLVFAMLATLYDPIVVIDRFSIYCCLFVAFSLFFNSGSSCLLWFRPWGLIWGRVLQADFVSRLAVSLMWSNEFRIGMGFVYLGGGRSRGWCVIHLGVLLFGLGLSVSCLLGGL